MHNTLTHTHTCTHTHTLYRAHILTQYTCTIYIIHTCRLHNNICTHTPHILYSPLSLSPFPPHTIHIHIHRRTLEKEAAAAVVKTTGEPTKQSSTINTIPPTENGSLRSMKSSSEASSSSFSASNSTVETRTHPQQRVRKAEGKAVAAVASSSESVPAVDIKALINQVGKDVRRTDKNHPYYKGENNINTKTLM